MYTRHLNARDFLEHTAPAVKALFNAISEEKRRYKPIKESREAEHRVHEWDYFTADLNEDFSESYVRNRSGRAAEARMQAELASHSAEVLCGAVFQIGKQGISLILTDKDRYSKGRMVGSQTLSSLIWHGRNQAMHWEEGVPVNVCTKSCFEKLKNDFGPQFDFNGLPRNMAWHLWDVIGWSTYDNYVIDMQDILESRD